MINLVLTVCVFAGLFLASSEEKSRKTMGYALFYVLFSWILIPAVIVSYLLSPTLGRRTVRNLFDFSN